jgi:hypothetical protein
MFEFKRVKIDYKKLRLSNHDYIFTYISDGPAGGRGIEDQKRPRANSSQTGRTKGNQKYFQSSLTRFRMLIGDCISQEVVNKQC